MIWAVGAGLFGGFEDGTLRPQETAIPRAGRKGLLRAAGLFGAAEPTEPSAEPTEPSEEPTAEPTDPTEPTEPETGFTVTFKGEGGYAKVNGEKGHVRDARAGRELAELQPLRRSQRGL